jgi:CheY-like chemotaxis protein
MMGKAQRSYQLTQYGRDAWEGQEAAVPAEYRRILWLMDLFGQAGVAEDLTRRYPENVLGELLNELEELGLIEPVPEGSEAAFAAEEREKTLALDESRLQRDAEVAGASLARTGAYVAADRLIDRPVLGKRSADIEILIVEDDPDQLALADLRVSMAGYRVRLARSVKDFLHSMLDHGTPDLLLLDVMLPDGDGFDVLTKMRRNPTLRSLPIVLLTAKNEPGDIGKGLYLGADGYVTKPYTKNILADVIRRVLKQDAAA